MGFNLKVALKSGFFGIFTYLDVIFLVAFSNLSRSSLLKPRMTATVDNTILLNILEYKKA